MFAAAAVARPDIVPRWIAWLTRIATRDAYQEDAAQKVLLDDIIGNPFRPVRMNPAWLTWNDAIVDKLAEGIYNEKAFDRLPILADALEEAGCAERVILDHLRGPGPHTRGCWVVDLCLKLG
jgi:hypothetical protein